MATITSLPTIAQMAGASRIVRGPAITNPTGDPSLDEEEEVALRTKIVERALEMVETDVEPATVWEVSA